ncbi:hypothetical protein PoB_007085700 [Plakobranchus ocellatus]|uniref:E3 ubiquitin-protein ligase RNF10 n=1 Tax=Plakobranchus ocellatus TaxID=259542 RepID=A0AAV4DJA4_9GAST|nr:hypothetical protein PoB_007085700 [Plakobranchus ocellatus]
MCDEANLAMEKKLPSRHSPCLSRNSGAIGEKRSDFLSNKNGRPKKHRDSSNGGKSQDPMQQTSRPVQKYGRGFSDKRPRQRGNLDYRQGEEVAEPFGLDVDLITSRKAKGNANHLLNFSYQDRSYHNNFASGRGAGSWGGRKAYRHHIPSYKKEQYLQASCQFIVQDDGDYSQQAFDPDALVDWDNVQLVRTFSSEIVSCPICLDVPIAAKITRCGHTYCWACILHYLQVNHTPKNDAICPVCPERIEADKLRSAQNIVVPDYKVGDEIEMKLMRKSKGSVFVCPQEDWTGKEEGHLNMDAGYRTKFSKLLLASWSQVKSQVLDVEKDALARGLIEAEQEEVCFLQMAQHLLENQEAILNVKEASNFKLKQILDATESSVGKGDTVTDETKSEAKALPPDVSFDGTKILTCYKDAFDDDEAGVQFSAYETASSGAEGCDNADKEIDALDMSAVSFTLSEDDDKVSEGSEEQENGSESSKTGCERGSPTSDIKGTLTPEEAADHLELPDSAVSYRQKRTNGSKPKDTFHFYQASTGQHIYMHSLNAQCLTREYGSLENSPKTVTATIVAIERIFMTEEMRKRLRYLNHIPLTTEFHVVELKIKPPVLSKETLKHFQPDFDKRRKFRQKKAKEEKIRASKNEVEHKKAHGIYVAPEIHIPLDNTVDFPSHLASSPETRERQRKESINSDIFPDLGSSDGPGSPGSGSPRFGDIAGSSPSFASFAQKLRSNSTAGTGVSPPAWPRVASSLSHSVTMPEMRSPHSSPWEAQDDDAEGDAYHAPSMASAWLSSLHDLATEPHAPTNPEDTETNKGGKKKKKKKEKQLLFSTSMVRKS